jgi:hypothetical protein
MSTTPTASTGEHHGVNCSNEYQNCTIINRLVVIIYKRNLHGLGEEERKKTCIPIRRSHRHAMQFPLSLARSLKIQ